MKTPTFLHLKPGDALPRLDDVAPFKAVLVIECEATPEWQAEVSDWLVRSRCRYMMAWGVKSGYWELSVDRANTARFPDGEFPEYELVMTTSHQNELLQETFWYSEQCATHPSWKLNRTYIIQIALKGRAGDLLNTFRAAQEEPTKGCNVCFSASNGLEQ